MRMGYTGEGGEGPLRWAFGRNGSSEDPGGREREGGTDPLERGDGLPLPATEENICKNM